MKKKICDDSVLKTGLSDSVDFCSFVVLWMFLKAFLLVPGCVMSPSSIFSGAWYLHQLFRLSIMLQHQYLFSHVFSQMSVFFQISLALVPDSHGYCACKHSNFSAMFSSPCHVLWCQYMTCWWQVGSEEGKDIPVLGNM